MKFPPAPPLVSSLALKHVLNSKFFLSWAPVCACQVPACAGVRIPGVLLDLAQVPWEACSEPWPWDALLCSELNPQCDAPNKKICNSYLHVFSACILAVEAPAVIPTAALTAGERYGIASVK